MRSSCEVKSEIRSVFAAFHDLMCSYVCYDWLVCVTWCECCVMICSCHVMGRTVLHDRMICFM